jgi:hypothetical protein
MLNYKCLIYSLIYSLGFRFGLPDLTRAEKTIINAGNKVHQLYEQKLAAPKEPLRLMTILPAG